MLNLFLVVGGAFVLGQGAKGPTLECRSPSGVASFRATMDPGSFVPGSGYFDLVGASLMDNYNQGALICNGNTLGQELNCVGFDNGDGGQVFYLAVTAAEPRNASYTMLKGAAGPEAGTAWPCAVQTTADSGEQ